MVALGDIGVAQLSQFPVAPAGHLGPLPLTSVHSSLAVAIPRVGAFPQEEAVSVGALGAGLCLLQGFAGVQSRLGANVHFDLGLKKRICLVMDCKCQNPAAERLAACGRTTSLPCCGCLSNLSCCPATWAQGRYSASAELLPLSIMSHPRCHVCPKGPACVYVLGRPKVRNGFFATLQPSSWIVLVQMQ